MACPKLQIMLIPELGTEPRALYPSPLAPRIWPLPAITSRPHTLCSAWCSPHVPEMFHSKAGISQRPEAMGIACSPSTAPQPHVGLGVSREARAQDSQPGFPTTVNAGAWYRNG